MGTMFYYKAKAWKIIWLNEFFREAHAMRRIALAVTLLVSLAFTSMSFDSA